MSYESELIAALLIAALDERDKAIDAGYNWQCEAENYRALYNRKCTWTHDVHHESDAWDTQCGNSFLLVEGTPKENDMEFCPYCGGRLVVPNC